MAHPLVRFALPLLLVALAGCEQQERLESFGGPTMGSTYTVKYVHSAAVAPKEQLQRETEALLARFDQELSTYRNDSDISRFNALPAGSCQAMPADVLHLVATGEQLSRNSEGALDLTVEPLLDLWGFGPKGEPGQVPEQARIDEVRQRVGHQHLRIDGDQLCKDAAVEVDFNSIAAGLAVDLVIEGLQKRGVHSYLVEITGELKAGGRKPDGSPWRIAIEAPSEGEQVAQRIVELDGYGVSTSGDYRNYFEQDGKRYSHTLDPRSGRPIEHALASVTVLTPSTLQADGLSTVLMVLGTERGLAFARQHEIAALFVTREGDGFTTQSSEVFDRLFGKGEEQ